MSDQRLSWKLLTHAPIENAGKIQVASKELHCFKEYTLPLPITSKDLVKARKTWFENETCQKAQTSRNIEHLSIGSPTYGFNIQFSAYCFQISWNASSPLPEGYHKMMIRTAPFPLFCSSSIEIYQQILSWYRCLMELLSAWLSFQFSVRMYFTAVR